MINKKGVIWVSAVLYIGLGIVVMTLILTAGLPMIEDIKDRNIVIQTKDIMYSLDDNIRYTKRSPGANKNMLLTIEKGGLTVNDLKELNNPQEQIINWSMKTKQKFLESYNPDLDPFTLKEGPLNTRSYETIIKDEYIINMFLIYTDIACLNVESEYNPPYSGTFTVNIEHTGKYLDGTNIDGKNKCTEIELSQVPPPPILPEILIKIS